MEKETKRTFQKMLELIQEQQSAIRSLQGNATPSSRNFADELADRIELMVQEVADRPSYEFDWTRLCDRHYAKQD